MREPIVANSGAPTQVASANTEISWPALATPRPKSAAMSFNMPVTIIAPVPMTKLPTQSVTSLGSMSASRGERGGALLAGIRLPGRQAVREKSRV
ncbi:hypothetical protein ACTMU2_37750 [Cupriavidus basilensis]